MKLGLGLVTSGGYAESIPTPFVDSLYALHSVILRGQLPGVTDLLKIRSQKFPIDCARNEIVREALAASCDALLFLDVDHTFPPEAVTRLFVAEKDIVTARYHVKRPPFHPNLYMIPAGTHTPGDVRCIHYGRGLFPVDRCGAGGLLIRRHVLEAIGDPWFRYVEEPHAPFDRAVSEDFFFCQRAQEEGFQIWADWDAEMSHLTRGLIDGAWYRGYLDTMERGIENGHADLVDDLVVMGYPEGYTLPSGRVVKPYARA